MKFLREDDPEFWHKSAWIERFDRDPGEVLRVRDAWMENSTSHVYDPGLFEVDGEFVGLTDILVAWTDYVGIDVGGALYDFLRAVKAAHDPGIVWGRELSREEFNDVASRAQAMIRRIDAAAEIACGEKAAAKKRGASRGNKPIESNGADPPPLSKHASAIYEMLCELPGHRAMLGREIIDAIYKKLNILIDESTLTGRLIPELKPYGVENKHRIGYRIPPRKRPSKKTP